MAGVRGGPGSSSSWFSPSQTTSSSFSGGDQIETRAPPNLPRCICSLLSSVGASRGVLGTLTNISTEWAHEAQVLTSSFLWCMRK